MSAKSKRVGGGVGVKDFNSLYLENEIKLWLRRLGPDPFHISKAVNFDSDDHAGDVTHPQRIRVMMRDMELIAALLPFLEKILSFISPFYAQETTHKDVRMIL